MLHLTPIPRAAVPVNAEAAALLAAPNYDEFQRDQDVADYIRRKPRCILRVTMPHCDITHPTAHTLPEGSPQALQHAGDTLRDLLASELVRPAHNLLFIYAMDDPTRPERRQIGLGGLAATRQIRTDDTPDGCIIRNEGIYQHKMLGRADLVQATNAFTDAVNLAVDDLDGSFASALDRIAASRPPDFEEIDHKNNNHSVWLIDDPDTLQHLTRLAATQPRAYVADGNHRSAAAHRLGYEGFLAILFTAPRMRIDPYHRLLHAPDLDLHAFLEQLQDTFTLEDLPPDTHLFQPDAIHTIGLYDGQRWRRLTARPDAFDPNDAVQAIDADILQRRVFLPRLGIHDPTSKALTFVGGDKGAAYLKQEVDAGRAQLAFAMPPVTMQQLIDVCLQGRFMPPKSTWFEPKIQSGLVIVQLP